MKTLFIDLDGCVFEHPNTKTCLSDITQKSYKQLLLPGVVEKFDEWYAKGYNLILTTGRSESMRQLTIEQLRHHGIFYDQLIMGLKYYPRVVINDTKPNGTVTAIACPLERNKGMEGLDI